MTSVTLIRKHIWGNHLIFDVKMNSILNSLKYIIIQRSDLLIKYDTEFKLRFYISQFSLN